MPSKSTEIANNIFRDLGMERLALLRFHHANLPGAIDY